MMEPETPRVGQKKDLRKAKQFSMRKAALSTGSKNAAPQAPDLSTSQNHSGIGDEMELDAYDDPSRPMAYSVQAQDEDELLANADRAKTELIEKARQIESLDYEIYENAVYRGKQASRTAADRRTYLILRWVYPILIGMLTAFTAFVINLCVENIAGYKFESTIHLNQSSTVMAFLVYCMFDVGLTIIATILTTFVSPPAAGSGIPDVKIYLNGVNLPGALLFSTLFTKVCGAICAIAGGLAVGKEGPTVHVGSCISAMLGQGGCKWYRLPAKWLKMFQNDRDRRDLITIGAACGVAAAFKAPVGGVLFVIEEASSWMRPKLLWRCFFGTAVVHITLRALRTWCEDGGCGKFGKGGFIIFNIKEGQFDYSPWEIFPVCLIGVIGGLLGTLFIRVNTAICKWRRANQKGWRKVWEAAAVAVLTALCSFVLPLMVSCRPCPEEIEEGHVCPGEAPGHYVNFHCSGENEYNDLATIFFNTQDDAIRNMFLPNSDKLFRAGVLLFFFCAYFTLAVVTYGLAVPSGLFIPCILTGCSYGRLVGMLVVHFGGVRGDDIGIEEGTYALLGAASFLGGCMRMTISLCVILVELTNNIAFLPLLMMVLLVSKGVGDQFGIGIYDVHVGIKYAPLLEEQPEGFMRHLKARDVMSKDVVSFGAVERVGYIVEALQNTTHNAFPVVLRRESQRTAYMDQEDENVAKGQGNAFGGVVLRSHLLWCLLNRHFQEGAVPKSQAEMHKMASDTISYDDIDFSTIITGPGVTIKDIPIIDEDLDKYLNLLPFLNPQPFVVPQSMGLAKTYQLFRTLGLRHLFVVPSVTEISGVITRKDLLPEFAELRHETLEKSEEERQQLTEAIRARQHSEVDAGVTAVPWSPRNRRVTPPRKRLQNAANEHNLRIQTDHDASEDDMKHDPDDETRPLAHLTPH